jgi:DNA-binding NarL/FixJ family response regulator
MAKFPGQGRLHRGKTAVPIRESLTAVPPPAIQILLVDDHFVVRSGLVASLELEDDMKVVGEADRGEEVVALYDSRQPDILLMDLQLPGISGIEATAELLKRHPDAHVLIFSTFARDEEIQAALRAGALGYLQKSSSRDDLLAAIRTVARGGQSLPPAISQRLRNLQAEPEITAREREILALVAQGNSNKAIAGGLGISEDTVKQHVSRILTKLKVNDRAQATAEAIRRGLVRL